MARAGFDPRAALRLWKILNEIEADVSETGEHGSVTDHIALLRTHPTGHKRLEVRSVFVPYCLSALSLTLRSDSGEFASECYQDF